MSPRSESSTGSTRPVVGLTTYREQAAWGVWQHEADLLHVEYADAVFAAGGIPVLLPPAAGGADLAGLTEVAAGLLARVDALVVTGGADVDPARYGQEPHPRTAAWRPGRDAWEVALLAAAAQAELPVLGICRGMQVMAVAAGGELDQHTPDLVGHEQHSPGGDTFGTVEVRTEPDTVVARVLGPGLTAHCHHHQSVRHHPGYVATATAEDGTVEAIETPVGFRIGVQWHPEMTRDQRLFDALVEAARGPTGKMPT